MFSDPDTGLHAPKIALPASTETIEAFVNAHIGYRAPSGLRRCLSTVSKLHQVAGVMNPLQDELVQLTMKQIGRGLDHLELTAEERAARPHHNLAGDQRQAKGFTLEHLVKIREQIPVDPLLQEASGLSVRKGRTARRQNGISMKRARDRALLHVAYDSLLRVGELVRVTLEHIEFYDDGTADLKVGKRKDNQEGEPEYAFLSHETVLELRRWCAMAQIDTGPLFCSMNKIGVLQTHRSAGIQKALTPSKVWDVYKAIAQQIGEEPTLFSCHSTRVGAAQDMLKANIEMPAVIQAGRWASDRMPSRYAKKGNVRHGGMAQLSKKMNR